MSENRAFGYTSIGLIAFAGIAVVLALLFMPTQADDVYFLNSGAGGGETTECINLASQYQVVLNSTDGNCFIRALANGTNISMTTNSTHIVISSSGGGETTVCAGQIGNYNIVASSSGGNCNFKNLLAGTGITLSSNSTHITITNSAPESTACNNVGTGNQLCSSGNVNIDSLIAGTGITITDTTDDYTFASQCANTGSGEAICESSNNINSLIGSSGINIADTTGDLTISPTWELLCQNTASAGATSISCSNIPDRNYMFVTVKAPVQTSSMAINMIFNSDTGTNYAYRLQSNFGAGSTATNQANMAIQIWDNADIVSIQCDIQNWSASTRKGTICFTDSNYDANDATVPNYTTMIGKWDNTSNAISTITFSRTSGDTGTFAGGSITVWGYD